MSWTERTELLVGAEGLQKLKTAHVLVVGLGGVGAYAAEMLCRAGVGNLTCVDADVVSESNRNRQLLALTSTVGKTKTEVMKERMLQINPEAKLDFRQIYVQAENIQELLNAHNFNYVVDAIDTLSPKVELIKACLDKGLKLISSMGAGAKFDPEKIKITDISKSYYCPLAHMLRKRLHALKIYTGFKVVFSCEKPIESAMVQCDNEPNKKTIVGTISYLPAIFGCYCASAVIRDLIN